MAGEIAKTRSTTCTGNTIAPLRQIKPRAFIVENVDGMRFAHNSDLFRSQLVRFRNAGYQVSYSLLDAKDYGLAQDRKRVLLVGIRSSERKRFVFPKPTHGPNGKESYRTLKDVIWRDRVAPAGSFDDEPLHWYYLSRNRRRTWCQQSPCIVAHWRHVGLHPSSPPLRKVGTDHWQFTHPGRARRYSYLECAALQGFPSITPFVKASSIDIRDRFAVIGNAVPPPLFEAVARTLVEQLTSA